MNGNLSKIRTVAIVPSAGSGRRMDEGGGNGPLKKSYVELCGKPLLAHTLSAFEDCSAVEEVILVVAPGDEERCRKEVVDSFGFGKVRDIIAGGRERQDSVGKALELMAGGGGGSWD
ncbi:MAG: 2-C-methyl-D-erythritol 4-phosphate cytidylyltransferase, partial [Thermodesulfobacteriota bacterium]